MTYTKLEAEIRKWLSQPLKVSALFKPGYMEARNDIRAILKQVTTQKPKEAK